MRYQEGTERERARNHLAGQRLGMCAFKDFYGETTYGPDDGFVYFITIGEPPIWVKIGYTKADPYARMATLQTGCPYPMKMLGFVLGTMGLEQDLHSVLEESRKQGEWFEYSERVARVIQAGFDEESMS